LKAKRGDAVHALIDAGIVAVLLIGLGLGIGVLQVLAVVDLHLGEEAGVFRLLQAVSTENCAIIFSVPGAHVALASEELRISFS
jgi:hypothetical protein